MILDYVPDSRNVLIAGIGGGYDILAGIPIYRQLQLAGKQPYLFNYSFTDLANAKSEKTMNLTKEVYGFRGPVINAPERAKKPYFPEGYLAEALNDTVWTSKKNGVAPTARAYKALCEHFDIDTIIYVDGGIDSIMHGDEEGCATFLEDTVSLAAGTTIQSRTCLEIEVKQLLVTIGFGTEIEDGLDHYRALENMAELIKNDGFLGSYSLTKNDVGFKLMKHVYEYIVNKTGSTSHITPKIIQAIEGEFGGDSFINMLMGMYFVFDPYKVLEKNVMFKNKMFSKTEPWTDVALLYRSGFGDIKKRSMEKLPL